VLTGPCRDHIDELRVAESVQVAVPLERGTVRQTDTAGTWQHVRAARIDSRPEVEEHLGRLEQVAGATSGIGAHRQQIYLHEKDATGLALAVSGISRAPLRDWQPAAMVAALVGGRYRLELTSQGASK